MYELNGAGVQHAVMNYTAHVSLWILNNLGFVLMNTGTQWMKVAEEVPVLL